MSLLWSGALILFLIIPLAVAAYVILLRRRRRFAIRYSSLSLVRDAMSPRQSWVRRHLPFALFLLALASLVMAFTRPVATVTVPSNKSTIILALDVSRSMCATDISPNRLEVAKDAAQSFIQNDRSGRLIGIVAFAGFAELIQAPTEDTRLLMSAVENLTTARRTAIGSAILRSIDAIAEVDNRIAPSDISASSGTVQPPPSEGVEPVPHIIVLLTDGASNAGPYPLTAATQAVERGIRVYTIGFGTNSNSSSMDCRDFQLSDPSGNNPGFGFNEPFGGGGGFRRQIDEVTLKQIAELTDASYYSASSADELQKVFQSLPTYLIASRETIEVSVFFTAIAVFAIVLALILSFLWNPLSY
jgi:Ca-activated chloride channel family protein